MKRQRDFPELEQTIVVWREEGYDDLNMRVAGCCWHVGITLIAEEDGHGVREGQQYYCLNKRLHGKDDGLWSEDIYDDCFYTMVEMIQNGEILWNVYGEESGDPT